jgi:hypothetical protein
MMRLRKAVHWKLRNHERKTLEDKSTRLGNWSILY